MRRKVILLTAVIFLCRLGACGKSAEQEGSDEKFYECQKGFMGVLGNQICESPEGYYFLMGNYLMFTDENLEQQTIVCNKAECLHNEERAENRVRCEAFFDDSRALSYYDGKLYILARNWGKKQEQVESIYEMKPDGSERKEFYSGGADTQAFCVHRGKAYVYEKKFTDESGKISKNPILTITEVPIQASKKSKIIFQTDEYEEGEINGLKCYQDYCYFCIANFLPQGIINVQVRINLETGEAEEYAEDSEYIAIGKDRVFSMENVESDWRKGTFKNNYYEIGLEGDTKRLLTEEDFSVLGGNIILTNVDDKYVYFRDIDYGEDEVPEEEQKLYVYTYDGALVCEILNGGTGSVLDFYSGNERYLFFDEKKEKEDGSSEIIFRYVDKEKFGKDAKVETLFRGTYDEFYGAVAY